MHFNGLAFQRGCCGLKQSLAGNHFEQPQSRGDDILDLSFYSFSKENSTSLKKRQTSAINILLQNRFAQFKQFDCFSFVWACQCRRRVYIRLTFNQVENTDLPSFTCLSCCCSLSEVYWTGMELDMRRWILIQTSHRAIDLTALELHTRRNVLLNHIIVLI